MRRYQRYNHSTASPTVEEYEKDGLILKINSHQCILYGKEVFLTPIEFKILLYLFEHQGSVVSSETLFEAVWKEKYLDNNNTVMAHIARLREKLHEEPRKPKLIKTVWGSAISLKNRNPLIRKLLTQYFVTTGILLAFLVMIPLVIRFVPEPGLGMERSLSTISYVFADRWLFCVAIGALLIWFGTTIYYMTKAIGYLNETIQATTQLIEEPSKRITLSSHLIDVQEEMNQLREKSLQDQRSASLAAQRKNDLIVYLAHDLRTPLTSVIGYLTLLKRRTTIIQCDAESLHGDCFTKAQRLELLISEFFEITRFNLTTIVLQTETTDLSLMLEQLTFEFYLSWKKRI